MNFIGACPVQALNNFNAKYNDWPTIYFLFTLAASEKAHTKTFYTDPQSDIGEKYTYVNFKRTIELLGNATSYNTSTTLGRKLKDFSNNKILKLIYITTKYGTKVYFKFTNEALTLLFPNSLKKCKKNISVSENKDEADDIKINSPVDKNIMHGNDKNIMQPHDKNVLHTNCIEYTENSTTTDLDKIITDFLVKNFGSSSSFSSDFIPTLQELLKNRDDKFVSGYLAYCLDNSKSKTKPKAYFYKTAKHPSVLQDFELSYSKSKETKKIVRKNAVCPSCGKTVEEHTCCECGLAYDDFDNAEEVYYYKQLNKLSEIKKAEYELSIKKIFDSIKPNQMHERQQQINALKLKYNLIK